MIKTPCKGCVDRPEGGGCHSKCERYAQFKQELVEDKQKRLDARKDNDAFLGYLANRHKSRDSKWRSKL